MLAPPSGLRRYEFFYCCQWVKVSRGNLGNLMTFNPNSSSVERQRSCVRSSAAITGLGVFPYPLAISHIALTHVIIWQAILVDSDAVVSTTSCDGHLSIVRPFENLHRLAEARNGWIATGHFAVECRYLFGIWLGLQIFYIPTVILWYSIMHQFFKTLTTILISLRNCY